MISQKRKKLLYELNDKKCEDCNKEIPFEEIEIHRIRRGRDGGTYEHRNCKVVCKKHHRLYHSKEFV